MDITKFTADNLRMQVTASGDQLIRVSVTILSANENKTLTSNFPPTQTVTRSFNYVPTLPGNYRIIASVYDSSGMWSDAIKFMLVPNRPPDRPTISVSNASPDMGGSISVTAEGSDLDGNLASIRIVGSKNGSSARVDLVNWDFSVTNLVSRSFTYDIAYEGPNSFLPHSLWAVATDSSGSEVWSSIQQISPVNPQKNITVKTQARSEGDYSIWFDHSDVVTKNIIYKKYAE